jgi:hypothetical protein
MSLKTLTGVLAAAVADAGTVVINYPAGYTRGDFIPGVNHKLVMNQAELKAPNKITLSFGASSVTITNKTGATWPAASPYVLQLEAPADQGQLATDGATRMPRVTPWPIRYMNLGSPIATVANNLRAAAALATTGNIALLITQLDVPRNIIITCGTDSSNNIYTVTSKDIYGNTVVENIAGVSGGVAAGKKAHYSNISITNNLAPTSGTIAIGVGNVLGLPGFLPNAKHILAEFLDGASATAGTTVAGDQAYPSATTGDVRGTYVPNSAPDGTKAYGLLCGLPDPGYLGADQFAG